MCDRIFAPFCPSIVHSNWILERGKLNNSYVQYFKLHFVQINYSMPDWRLIEAMSLKSTPKTAFSKWCNNFQYLLLTIVKRTFIYPWIAPVFAKPLLWIPNRVRLLLRLPFLIVEDVYIVCILITYVCTYTLNCILL